MTPDSKIAGFVLGALVRLHGAGAAANVRNGQIGLRKRAGQNGRRLFGRNGNHRLLRVRGLRGRGRPGRQAGGKIDKNKFSIGEHGCISLVYDTEGNMIGLHSMQ